MKIINEDKLNNSIITYKISSYEATGINMNALLKEYPNNIKVSQIDNYDTYRIIGTQDEVSPIIQTLKSKGLAIRKVDTSSRDIKWYNSVNA